MAELKQEDLQKIQEFVVWVTKQKNEPPVYVGIDTGAEGAIGFLCKKHAIVVDIPTFKLERKYGKKLNAKERKRTGKKTKATKGKKTVFDYQGMAAIFRALRPIKHLIRICVEEAQIMVRGRGQGAYVAYRVGFAFGLFPFYITTRGWPAEYPHPGVWKTAMGLKGKDKSYSLRKAKNLFPKVPLNRKKDHNRAEALLLCVYMKKLYD